MASSIVQFGSSGPDGNSITLGSAPVNGNLLIAVVSFWNSTSPGSGWTQVFNQSASLAGIALAYKYAGASESTTQTPFTSSGTSFASCIYELSGVPSTWATAAAYSVHNVDQGSAGTTYSPPAQTTGTNNIMDFIFLGGNGGTAATAASISITTATNDGNFHTSGISNTDSLGAAHHLVSTSGSSTTYTGTWSSSQSKFQYVVVGIVWTPATGETGTITTTLSGISQTFNGTVTHNKTATITTTLSGVSQTFNATLHRNRIAAITTSLSGISQVLNATRANRFFTATTSLGGLAQSFGALKDTATGATNIDSLGPLDWRIAIVDKNGRPTPEFQRRWNTQRNVNSQLADLGSDANPVMDGLVSPGVSNRYSRGDHKHPSDTSRLSTTDAAATYLTIANAASTYLTITNAASTYLTISSAATTYAPLRTTVTTVSGLPPASTAGDGATYIVTDASSPTLGATVTGGGSTRVRVNSDGTFWKVG